MKHLTFMKLLAYLFISLCTLLYSCKKNSTSVDYIDNSFKPWALFQKGSYWVYLDEKAQIIDSTYINMQPLTYLSPPAPASHQYECITYNISNSFIKTCVLNADGNNPFLNFWDFNSDNEVLDNYSANGNHTQNYSTGFSLVEIIDTVIINSKVFTNVVHTKDTNNYYLHRWRKDYYFAKNIGLLKFSIKTDAIDSTWSLLRWHTIQ